MIITKETKKQDLMIHTIVFDHTSMHVVGAEIELN